MKIISVLGLLALLFLGVGAMVLDSNIAFNQHRYVNGLEDRAIMHLDSAIRQLHRTIKELDEIRRSAERG